jgi:hypothetical protein
MKNNLKVPVLLKTDLRKIDSTTKLPKESWDVPDGRPMIHINSTQIPELATLEVGQEYKMEITVKLLRNELLDNEKGDSYTGKLAVTGYTIEGMKQ